VIIEAGMAVECRVALTGEWIPGEATSGVEGAWKDGKKIHDFPVVWVWVHGVDGPMPWPATDVRLPEVS
jgi:hypothetical protein